MTRSVPEWIGKTDDSAAPARVRIRIFDAHKGRCHISGRKIMPGEKWELEHITALCNGGENRESNLAPALVEEHKKKTRADRAEKKRIDRMRKKHLGQHKSAYPPMAGTKRSGWRRGFTGNGEPR